MVSPLVCRWKPGGNTILPVILSEWKNSEELEMGVSQRS